MSVYPCLTYRDVRSALDWLERAFGIRSEALVVGDDRQARLDHAILLHGEGKILVESERPAELHGPHAGQAWIYLTVTDAEAHYRHACAEGAHTLGAPHGFGDNEHGYSARDPEGNTWTFGTARP